MVEETPITLQAVANRYLETLDLEDRAESQTEVGRFVRWCGADRAFDNLSGQEVANYAQTLTGTLTDASRRADAVRKLLAFAKKAKYSTTNLGSHLRLPKGRKRVSATGPAPKVEQLSEEGKAALAAELESLKAQRPQIVADIQRAREDKDFRENAPLDAARQQQAYVEGRIRGLEGRLANAVVAAPDAPAFADVVAIGSTVRARNLSSGTEVSYTLVRPDDANAAQGRISFESPVGQAFLGCRAGDEVEVAAPSGTLRFRVEQVEA